MAIREGGEGGGMEGTVSGADGARGPRVALSDLTSPTDPGESGETSVAQVCVARKGPNGFARLSSQAKPPKYRASGARVGRKDSALPTGYCEDGEVPSAAGAIAEIRRPCPRVGELLGRSGQPWRAEMTPKRKSCRLNYHTWQAVRRSESGTTHGREYTHPLLNRSTEAERCGSAASERTLSSSIMMKVRTTSSVVPRSSTHPNLAGLLAYRDHVSTGTTYGLDGPQLSQLYAYGLDVRAIFGVTNDLRAPVDITLPYSGKSASDSAAGAAADPD
eukprot:2443489-Prymnesium_polylepis.3